MLRFMEFLPCAALMSVLGLRYIWGVLADKGIEKKLAAIVCYALPFAAVLAIAAGLYAYDGAVWSRGEWGTYRRFDDSRIAMSDYGIPAYEEIPETYDSLGLSETAVEVLQSWNFYDPDLFNKETMDAITAARDVAKPAPSLGECLGKLLDTCTVRFFEHQAVYLLLIVFALWLVHLCFRDRYILRFLSLSHPPRALSCRPRGYGAFHGGHHRPDLDSEKGVLQ